MARPLRIDVAGALYRATSRGDAILAQSMRHLNGVHTLRFDRWHRVMGHLFQWRYKAILTEEERHRLESGRAGQGLGAEFWTCATIVLTKSTREI